MVLGSATRCAHCGDPLREQARFCPRCGTPVAGPPHPSAAPTAPAATPQVPQAARAPGAVGAATAVRTAPQLGQLATAAGLPWQTIVGGQAPDIGGLLARAATPAAHTLVRRSLRRPGIALAVTTAMDLLIVLLTGGSGALTTAVPRVLTGLGTSAVALATGSKGGPLRGVAGLGSLVTTVLQLTALWTSLTEAMAGGADWLTLAPGLVAMASAGTTALKTATTALRRR